VRAAALALVFVAGCGASGVTAYREAISTAASAGAEADRLIASRYAAQSAKATRRAKSFDEWQSMMHGLDAAVDSIDALHASLLSAETALDAYEAGNRSEWLRAAACVSASLEDLARTLRYAHVPVPVKIDAAIRAIAPWVSHRCIAGGP